MPARWRTPAVVISAGCLIGVVSFGLRSSFGVRDRGAAPRGEEHHGHGARPDRRGAARAGLAGASFMIVLAAFARMVPEKRRSWAMGLATAAGSLGQFLFAPLGQAFIARYGAVTALVLAGAYWQAERTASFERKDGTGETLRLVFPLHWASIHRSSRRRGSGGRDSIPEPVTDHPWIQADP